MEDKILDVKYLEPATGLLYYLAIQSSPDPEVSHFCSLEQISHYMEHDKMTRIVHPKVMEQNTNTSPE